MNIKPILIAVLAFCATVATADDKPRTEAEREADEANTLTLESFERMECFTVGEKPVRLEAAKGSRLRWTNPVVGRVYGNVFLWIDDSGRPAAVASIYKAFAPWNSLDVECSSLSTEKLKVTCDGRAIWTPPPSEIVWKPLPSAPKPASTEKQRLIQMRRLVRRFDARVADSRLDQESAVDRGLRALTQPIYRYAAPAEGVVDAGMFAFAIGTDPEAMLLLEVRNDEAAGPGWYYAPARMNRDGLVVDLDGKTVWKAEFIPVAKITDPGRPYRAAPVPE